MTVPFEEAQGPTEAHGAAQAEEALWVTTGEPICGFGRAVDKLVGRQLELPVTRQLELPVVLRVDDRFIIA